MQTTTEIALSHRLDAFGDHLQPQSPSEVINRFQKRRIIGRGRLDKSLVDFENLKRVPVQLQ